MIRLHRTVSRAVTAAAVAVLTAAASAHAQGVGINATGAAADTSAILDLSSTTKGLLVPRMTAAQRAAIVMPATGLVVFQTDGTPGLYWNAGSIAAPSWKLIGESGAGASQWSTLGSHIFYDAGAVGVNALPGQFRFAVQDTGHVLRVQSDNPTGVMVSLGGNGQVQVDAPNVPGGRLALLGNGNLGLGVTDPTSKLSFAAVSGKKISLYPVGSSDYGLGVTSGRLQIFSDGFAGGGVAIGTDNAGTFTERFAVKNNGALAVGGNTGAAGQVLQSGGSGNPAAWVNPMGVAYNNCYQFSGTSRVAVASGQEVVVPGLQGNLTLGGNARVIVNANLFLAAESCASCPEALVWMLLFVDGNLAYDWPQRVAAGDNASFNTTSMFTLGPGTHTIDVRFRPHGNTVWVGVASASSENKMNWQVIPQ